MTCDPGFENSVGLYYINCRKSIKRLKKFIQGLEHAGITGCRQVCVDGSKYTNRKIINLVKKGEVSPEADMTPIEVAIAFSYKKVFKRFIISKYDYAIILEDDIQVKSNFKKDIDSILTKLHGKFDVLYLWNGNFAQTKTKQKKIIQIRKNIIINQETKIHNAGNSAFIISKAFAKRLLKLSKQIEMPYDMLMGEVKGKHFTIKMTKGAKGCDISPLIKQDCGGQYGTGKSLQNYEAPSVQSLFA